MFPVQKLYEYIGVAAIIALFGGFMYFKGWSGEHDKFVAFQSSVAQAGKDQNAKSKEKDDENAKENQQLVAGWIDDRNHLLAQLERMRNSGSGSMPKDASGSKTADAAIQEPGRACQSTEFYGNALEDAQKLRMWHDWAVKHQLPVE